MIATPAKKERALLDLFGRWSDCEKCPLAKTRTNIVFPDGNPDADVAVIGIGPGETEDNEGAPFVGESGLIVNDYLKDVQLSRQELFIMNIVQCRPMSYGKNVFGKVVAENRDPTQPEKDACRELWEEALYIVDPLLVIAMGKPAVQEVTRKRSITMGEAAGKIDRCTIQGRVAPVTYPVMCMYHPAFLARSGNTYQGGPWHQALVAWQRAVHFLDQLRNAYRGTEMPKRPFKREDMFLIDTGGVS